MIKLVEYQFRSAMANRKGDQREWPMMAGVRVYEKFEDTENGWHYSGTFSMSVEGWEKLKGCLQAGNIEGDLQIEKGD